MSLLSQKVKFEFRKSDLSHDKYTYYDHATGGDNPSKKKEDALRINRSEDYEMVDFINSFNPTSINTGLTIELLIQEEFRSTSFKIKLSLEIKKRLEEYRQGKRLMPKF